MLNVTLDSDIIGLGPPCNRSNLAWIGDCSLQNAAEVREILEKYPGLVSESFITIYGLT